MPERLDRIRLGALQLSDLVFVLDVVFGTCEMLEPLLEDGDFFLVGTGFLQLQQGFPGDVLESGAIKLRVIAQGRGREVQANACFALICARALSSASVGISM
jgi:hypothetical protein